MSLQAPSVISPVTLDTFLSTYWESQPLHIERTDANYFQSLICVEDIESVLTSRDLYFPSVQLAGKNQKLQPSDYVDADQRIQALRLLQMHRAGATLVISQAQSLFQGLDRLCREVTRSLQMRCQTNVYLSPAVNQGFAAHYDTHDVLILQVSGDKTFNFYTDGVDLPFPDDQFDRAAIGSEQLTGSVHLSAGDTLYIPRGMVHDAVAGDQRSLHITLGLFPPLMRDLLLELVQIAAESDRRLRQSLPVGQELTMHALEDPARSLKDLINSLADSQHVEEAIVRLEERLALSMRPDVSQYLSAKQNDSSISSSSVLCLKPCSILGTRRMGNTLVLHTFGQVLEFEVPFDQAVEQILDGETFRPAEINCLSADQQLAFCQRMLKENLLVAVT